MTQHTGQNGVNPAHPGLLSWFTSVFSNPTNLNNVSLIKLS